MNIYKAVPTSKFTNQSSCLLDNAGVVDSHTLAMLDMDKTSATEQQALNYIVGVEGNVANS